jgi:hypothetical protein
MTGDRRSSRSGALGRDAACREAMPPLAQDLRVRDRRRVAREAAQAPSHGAGARGEHPTFALLGTRRSPVARG